MLYTVGGQSALEMRKISKRSLKKGACNLKLEMMQDLFRWQSRKAFHVEGSLFA